MGIRFLMATLIGNLCHVGSKIAAAVADTQDDRRVSVFPSAV